VRGLQSLTECYYFQQHKFDTTAVRFNAKGNLIASGDAEGNVIVWESFGSLPVRKLFDKVVVGKVMDIAWLHIFIRSPDDKRLIIVGEGKQTFGRVFLFDTATNGGEISGASKCLNSTDVRPQKLP